MKFLNREIQMGRFIVFIWVLGSLSTLTQAQITITGKITEAKTGEGLPAVHVIEKGTYNGTIANEDGLYSLTVKRLPATIVVRYIGFDSQEKTVNVGDSRRVNFNMVESVFELSEIMVTSEDPAEDIMREVIARKKIWREKLKTYTSEAYSRQQLKNDTTIVSISESVSELFWDKEKGVREILKSRRQTANIEGADNFAGVSYLPNFYDDELEIAGFDVVGITDERALKYYNFSLIDYTSRDGKVVYEIKVSPRRKLQPLFEGTIFVLDEEFALLSVKLKPNKVIVFPPPIQDFNLYYEQQFSNFGGDFWLPVDVRIDGLIEVGIVGLRFPPIGFHQVSKLNNYLVNVDLPDSLFTDYNWISVDSTLINKPDSIFTSTIEPVPLSEKEVNAYENLDSTATLEKAFKPKGFFTRFIDFDDDDSNDGGSVEVSSSGGSSSSTKRKSGSSQRKERSALAKFGDDLSPVGRFNRVDVFHLGLVHDKSYGKTKKWASKAKLAYSTGYEELAYGGSISWWPLKKSKRLVMTAAYNADTKTSYESDIYNMVLTSGMSLLGYNDYFNFYRHEGVSLSAGYIPKGMRATLRARYKLERHESIIFKTSYDILGQKNVQRLNPAIDDGTLSALVFEMSEGDYKTNFGAVGLSGYKIGIEQSVELLGSDWNYTKFNFHAFKRFNTFYKKRFFPNTLDVRVNGGTYLGDLPLQKYGALDASFGYFTPFGAFKSKRYIPYAGASYFAVNAEHNFRSVPLEMLGWRNAPKTGLSIIAFGGVGKTWVPSQHEGRVGYLETGDLHLEVGGSISNIFNLFRFDLAFRIDDPGIYPGVSIARFF